MSRLPIPKPVTAATIPPANADRTIRTSNNIARVGLLVSSSGRSSSASKSLPIRVDPPMVCCAHTTMPMRTHLLPFAGIALVAVTASCGRTEPAAWTVSVQRLASPAGPNSSEPQIVDSGRGRIQLGRTRRHDIAPEIRRAHGVGMVAGRNRRVGKRLVPQLCGRPVRDATDRWDARRTVAATARSDYGSYNLRLSYSKDNGKTWAPSFMPHNDGTKTQHGFASLLEMPGNTLAVVWLDGRNSTFDFDKPDTGTMTLRYAAFDSAWKQTTDVEIDHKVCECCPTTAVATSDGVLAAFRDRSDDEVRDVAVSRLENGKWTTATAVAADNWKLDFCPVNGPMLTARGRNVVATWFTVKNDLGQAYAAFSTDAGRTWGMPIRLDDGGSLGRVDVELLDDGLAVASWVDTRRDVLISGFDASSPQVRSRRPSTSPPSPEARRAATRASRVSTTS